MSPEQILKFLDDFRLLHGSVDQGKSRLISLKVPESLLNVFKAKAEATGTPYQTQIKRLMKAWIQE